MPAADVVIWLQTAYRSGLTDELLGDIINDIQHQGDTSEAMYAVGASKGMPTSYGILLLLGIVIVFVYVVSQL